MQIEFHRIHCRFILVVFNIDSLLFDAAISWTIKQPACRQNSLFMLENYLEELASHTNSGSVINLNKIQTFANVGRVQHPHDAQLERGPTKFVTFPQTRSPRIYVSRKVYNLREETNSFRYRRS